MSHALYSVSRLLSRFIASKKSKGSAALRKFWGKFKSDTKILKEYVVESDTPDLLDCSVFAIHEICNLADCSKPVFLNKHFKELKNFNRTVFYTTDFFNETGFEELELEIIASDKKKNLL